MSTGYTADALRAAITRLDEIEAIFDECDYTEEEIVKPLQHLSAAMSARLERIERSMRAEWKQGPVHSNAER